jgi:hypothetical protein
MNKGCPDWSMCPAWRYYRGSKWDKISILRDIQGTRFSLRNIPLIVAISSIFLERDFPSLSMSVVLQREAGTWVPVALVLAPGTELRAAKLTLASLFFLSEVRSRQVEARPKDLLLLPAMIHKVRILWSSSPTSSILDSVWFADRTCLIGVKRARGRSEPASARSQSVVGPKVLVAGMFYVERCFWRSTELLSSSHSARYPDIAQWTGGPSATRQGAAADTRALVSIGHLVPSTLLSS